MSELHSGTIATVTRQTMSQVKPQLWTRNRRDYPTKEIFFY
jgi:hypothetical protein